ncbi:ATP-binding cassette domain-containing protein [Photobacterium japonica]|uniref:ABC transporter ATP-binding protein n=1 Tax=Photobacterium japonica TaxID=2910235 RepID=UPI003D0BD308
MFKVEHATFQIGEHRILQPTTLQIEQGKVTTLLGHNGSGKSTVMKLLSRQHAPTTGSVSCQGRDIATYAARDFALQVAYLPQHPPVTDGVTVRELVFFGRYPWKGVMGRYNTDDARYVDEAIERVGLAALSARFVSTLSGGERQRAWVAMLLAQRSQCILLDEPTSALDVAHQYELLSLIRRLNQQLGLTVVMVLHDINMAARFSDHLVAMHSGRVLAEGSPAELMNAPQLAQIYGVPLGLFAHPDTGLPISYVR